MKASVTVVTTKWVFRYIQLAASSSHSVPAAQACTDGSTKTCSVFSRLRTSWACAKAAARSPYTCPRTSRDSRPGPLPGPEPVQPVRAAEEEDLAQQVERTPREQPDEHPSTVVGATR